MHVFGTSLLDPKLLVDVADIRSGHTVVDLSSGHLGHRVFHAASRAGDQGHVYAVDVRRPALESIEARKQLGHGGHITTVHGDPERACGVPLEDGIADIVLLVNALSLAGERLELVREAHRLLKSAGTLLVVDWLPYGDTTYGPAAAQRLSEQEARSTCLVTGVEHVGAFPAGPRHYGFVCKKP